MARVVGGVIVCVMIVAIDVVAGVLSIKAGLIAQNKRDSGCGEAESEHHDKEVFKLGLAAAALQAVAHIVANLLGAFMCICCTEELERSTANRQLWFASLALSWIVAGVGFAMLIAGMLENSKSSLSSSSCGKLHNHFFVIGSILCFLHALLLCIALYVSATFSLGNESS
ncbi:hypothetical protein AB3S75_020012 [Citrus x aurantiifolia]